MKIALFSEDKYHKALQILTQRILGKQTGVIMRSKKRHDLLKTEKVYSHIVHDILQEHSDISKIIVCVDSECTPEEEVLKELKRLENSIKVKTKQPIYYLCVTHALEGWLLGDPDGIKQYLGPRAKVHIPPSASLECKPKDIMKDIFREVDKDFLPSLHNERIAEIIDLKIAGKNNKSFYNFQTQVRDP